MTCQKAWPFVCLSGMAAAEAPSARVCHADSDVAAAIVCIADSSADTARVCIADSDANAICSFKRVEAGPKLQG